MSFIYILFLKYSKPTVKIILKMSMSIAHGEAPSPGADYSFLCLSSLSKSSIIAIVFATVCPSYHCHFVDRINAEDIQLQSDVCSSVYKKQI